MAREADSLPRAVRAGVAVYRGLLHLYPHDFLRQHGDELEDDFLALSQEAWNTGGAAALARSWADAAFDAVRSFAREWLDTPWPPILGVAALVAAGVFWASMGRTQLPLRAFRHVVVPDSPAPDDSGALLVLMAIMLLIPIAGVLVFWGVARLIHRQPRSWRGRA